MSSLSLPTPRPLLLFSGVYAYLRYSSDGQADGMSLERQRGSIAARLAAMGLENIPLTIIQDPGLSAFRGKHLKSGELGKFMRAAAEGALPRESLFIAESVSRASRQGGFALLGMLNTLLGVGFSVLFLDMDEPFNAANIPQLLSVRISLYAELAREESAIKSRYAKSFWNKRRKEAVAAIAESGPGSYVFTGECPNWLRVVGGRYELIPELASSINQLYDRVIAGDGISRLTTYANKHLPAIPGARRYRKDGTPRKNAAREPVWQTSLVQRVLENRALIGEFVPHHTADGKRSPIPDALIKNFYPVAVDPDKFFAVQRIRANAPGFPARRDGNNHNYLLGIGKCACGGSWRWLNKTSGTQAGYSQYSCSRRELSVSDCAKINGRVFDHAFIPFALSAITELLSTGENPQARHIISLEQQRLEIEQRRDNSLAMVERHPDMHDMLAARLRAASIEHDEIMRQLARALADEPPPAGFSFDEALEVFLPAYLDVYAEGCDEYDDAFSARGLFALRIRQAVKTVVVAADRSSLVMTLKNGASASLVIEDDGMQRSYSTPVELDAMERGALVKQRAAGLRNARRLGGAIA